MKKCIFGGTFDPPHIGHLLIAQTICEAEEFDKIIFVPALKNPHKSVGVTSSIDSRLKMLESAVEGNPHFEISDIEIKRGGISYSIDTIKFIKEDSFNRFAKNTALLTNQSAPKNKNAPPIIR